MLDFFYSWWFPTEEKMILSGLEKIKSVYVEQRLYSEKISAKHNILKEDNFLSNDIPFNDTKLEEVRKKINSYREKVKIIISNITKEVQDFKFSTTDKLIKDSELNEKDQKRYLELKEALKEIYSLYEIIRISINIMKKFNENVIFDIEKVNGKQKTDLMILNGIIVYEITNLIIDLIQSFKIPETDNLKKINNEISSNLNNLEKNDENLLKETEKIESTISENIKKQIEERKKIRPIVDDKWLKIWDSINDIELKVSQIKEYLPSLNLIKANLKNYIMAGIYTPITDLVDANSKIFGEISEITNRELLVLSKEDICNLFGLKTNLNLVSVKKSNEII